MIHRNAGFECFYIPLSLYHNKMCISSARCECTHKITLGTVALGYCSADSGANIESSFQVKIF